MLGWEAWKYQGWWADPWINAACATIVPVGWVTVQHSPAANREGCGWDAKNTMYLSWSAQREGQREFDSSLGREMAAGTAEESHKCFALIPPQ